MLSGLYENRTAQQEIPTLAMLARNDMGFQSQSKAGRLWLTETWRAIDDRPYEGKLNFALSTQHFPLSIINCPGRRGG